MGAIGRIHIKTRSCGWDDNTNDYNVGCNRIHTDLQKPKEITISISHLSFLEGIIDKLINLCTFASHYD